jgi:hypothetical protein
MQNEDVSMTKDAYFEMCEMLGNEPLEEEIPIEFSDFPILVQQVFTVYHYLPDKWDPMGGNYLGKDLSIVFHLFGALSIEPVEESISLQLLMNIDAARRKVLNKKEPKKTP